MADDEYVVPAVSGPIQMEELMEPIPDLALATTRFVLGADASADKDQLKNELLAGVTEKNMAPFYEALCEEFGWEVDAALVASMEEVNAAKVAELDAKIADAEENLGENEVREAMLEKAEHYARIADKDEAVSALRAVFEKTVGAGQKLDVVFTLIRLGLFWSDDDLITRNITKAKDLLEQGGDWDRRNRLRVYEGVFKMTVRDFDAAATLFLDTLATFTSYEIFSYEELVYYTVLLSSFSLSREDYKTKVLEAPEVLSVVGATAGLETYMKSLYECDYAAFFSSLADMTDRIQVSSRYLASHARFYSREMRIKSYNQLLESYRSLSLRSMADSFGVSVEFMDRELSRFIASGRLNSKIDKVSGVVATTRPDAKNAQYQALIVEGDKLLSRIQRLSRVVNL